MLDFLELGPLMDEAGGGDGGGGVAVADASSDFGGGAQPSGDTGDSHVHDAEFVDPENAPITETEPQQSTALVKAGERAVQNGKFTQSGRAAIEAVKALNPKLGQEVIQALLASDYYRQQFPGGKKEVQQLRQLAQQHGGEQGIAEIKQKADYLSQLDSMFEASDPQFIENITSYDEGRNGFVGLMQPALQKFEKLAPQQFNYHRMKDFVHFMETARLPSVFATQAAIMDRANRALAAGNHELAASFLAEIIGNHNSIAGALEKVYEAAKNPPAEPIVDPRVKDDRSEIVKERETLRQAQWDFAVTSERKQLFARAWADQTKGRTLTKDQEDLVKLTYNNQSQIAMRQWQNNAARFFANNDKDGYLKEQFAFAQKQIPDSLRRAFIKALPAKPGPKAAGGPLKPPVNGKPATDRNGNAIRVAKMPPTSQLDPVRTTSEMLSANKAYTKDGKLVQWA